MIAAGAVATTRAEEIHGERGKVYRDCEVISKDKHGVTFRHSKGVAKVAYERMPEKQQKHFGYDRPAKSSVKGSDKSRTGHEGDGSRSHGTTVIHRNANGGITGYGTGYSHSGRPQVIRQAYQRPVYVSRPGTTDPNFRTVSLNQLIRYRNNGYSNIAVEGLTYQSLYNQHFNRHASSHYQGSRNAIVQLAPRYLGYVRNVYPRQIGTYNVGPSGGSLVPPMRSGYSSAGSIAPSLVPSAR